jgi:hypothetical protein
LPCGKASDLLLAAAHGVHRFEEFSPDFAVCVIFSGSRR